MAAARAELMVPFNESDAKTNLICAPLLVRIQFMYRTLSDTGDASGQQVSGPSIIFPVIVTRSGSSG
jgi:hypothetical protein